MMMEVLAARLEAALKDTPLTDWGVYYCPNRESWVITAVLSDSLEIIKFYAGNTENIDTQELLDHVTKATEEMFRAEVKEIENERLHGETTRQRGPSEV